MKPTLVVLAAGMGSRYGSLKQLDGVGPNNETIIDYSVYDAIRAGFGKVVFVIRSHFKDDFESIITNKFKDKIKVAFAFQEVNSPVEGIDELPDRLKPWGTAHAVLVAEDVVNEPFAVINADDFYGAYSFKVMADFLTNNVQKDLYSMVGFVLKNTLSENGSVSRGVCEMDEQRHLVDVVERTKIQRENGAIYFTEDEQKLLLKEDSLVSMNFWGFHPDIFGVIKSQFIEFVKENFDQAKAEFYIPLVVNRQIQSNEAKVSVLTSEDKWYGVTYKEDKAEVQNALATLSNEEIYPKPLWS